MPMPINPDRLKAATIMNKGASISGEELAIPGKVEAIRAENVMFLISQVLIGIHALRFHF
jgi:hypothetical protein